MRLVPGDAQGEPEQPGGSSGEDWLSSLRQEPDADVSPGQEDALGQAGSEEFSESETPDWLSRIRERARMETGAQAGESGAEDETPDWMSGLDSEPETGGADEGAASSSWLVEMEAAGGQADEPGTAPQGAAVAPSDPVGEEWMDELSAWRAGAESEPAEAASPVPGDLPGWLDDGTVLGEDLDGNLQLAQEPPESPAEAGSEDLLAGFAVEGESTVVQQPVEPDLPAPAEETPEWLRDFSSQAPAENSGSVIPLIETAGLEGISDDIETGVGIAAGELPDWLSEEGSPPSSGQEVEAPGEPLSEELARAELPEWVKEMRPIESVLPGEAAAVEPSQQVEQAGPLAGLRGVLPIEDLKTHYRKPPVYSARLRLSEKQHSHASMLESIVAQEAQPLLIPRTRARAPQVFTRVLVTLFIFAVLTVVRIFPLGLVPGALLAPPELDDMFNQIEQVSEQNAPVLLAVDYEPGRFGEMYFASLPVIEHLMAKNVPIVVLSTVPTGPALAQRLLQEAADDLREKTDQTYDPAVQTLNLGYLPGGTISLLEFAQLPSRAAPATLEGNFDIWKQPFLANVKGLDGFSQVIVLTDSAETGRAWIEQVKPLMGTAPLLMVTSAQAAPLLMPYLQSQQVNGMVSGFLGGVTYGQWRHVDTPADPYWESYQVGVLLAVGVILFGGLFSLARVVIRRKDGEGE